MSERIARYTHDGLEFDVLDQGPLDGPIVLLLHGFPERAASWSAVMNDLNEAGFRTIAPDQRGYSPGARPKRRRDYRVGALVDDIVALIDTIGSPVHLVGHDWGAMIAWVTAGRRPDLVSSLTAFSVPHPGSFMTALLTSRQILHSWYFAFFQLPVLPEKWMTRPGQRAEKWYERSGMNADDLERTRTDIVDYGALPYAVTWYRGLPFSNPGIGRLRITVPTSMVWSDGDTFIGRSAIERAQQYVDARYTLTVLAGVTHWIPTQAPTEAAQAIIANSS
ncbi:alpha/beta fold hydrolase [Rhodococcus fascians]|uniref:alpha/beta fold hydrolase n=1 Tax=Rhodococcus sp. NKCM2511 TaxID=2766011 RepID=UPI0019107C64|nr:alpha/beta fold hydrolase [Rhodococcus sp. NKCM2511]MBY3791189.1 alpha/beta fold hydrolase [Rhodococcus fascians]MBY3823885.1 alpha/beta fold hydrolase [Rhodococcus fascians]MBY3834407.1 alpha/beta fold hydrolase [Rhodococcus fascians]MBY3863620.1 alpha/beta fold hydrolase [Rhodococcus fascians]MBY3883090.1 alpha/beta fold hydrolase [Rhodococcus fascians]